MAVVKNSRLPATTGVDMPRQGISIFQRTFCVSLNVSGTGPGATPVCDGPRQWGQEASLVCAKTSGPASTATVRAR